MVARLKQSNVHDYPLFFAVIGKNNALLAHLALPAQNFLPIFILLLHSIGLGLMALFVEDI